MYSGYEYFYQINMLYVFFQSVACLFIFLVSFLMKELTLFWVPDIVLSALPVLFCLFSNFYLCPWDSPGKNTGVGCHFLLQGIFPTPGSNPHPLCLLHWQVDSLPLNHGGSRYNCLSLPFSSLIWKMMLLPANLKWRWIDVSYGKNASTSDHSM